MRSTKKYKNVKKSSNTRDRFMHLTNYSVNKHSSEFVANTGDDDGAGNKWSLSALWRHLAQQGRTVDELRAVWASIKVVIQTTHFRV